MINRNNWNLLAGLTNVLCKFLRKNCTQSCCLRKICTQSCCLRKICTQSCCLRKNCTQSCCLSKYELYINVYNVIYQSYLGIYSAGHDTGIIIRIKHFKLQIKVSRVPLWIGHCHIWKQGHLKLHTYSFFKYIFCYVFKSLKVESYLG